jgi:hypothetical protein
VKASRNLSPKSTTLPVVTGSGREYSNALNASSIMFEVDLAQFVLFHGGAPNKAASGRLTVSLSRLPRQLRGLAMLLSSHLAAAATRL